MTPAKRDLRAWLDEDFAMTVAVKCEDGQWFALLMDFDITGCGPTARAALHDAFGLLGAYLGSYYEDGVPFREAIRPIPMTLKVRIHAESAFGRLARHIASRSRLAHEALYDMPLGLVPELATA